MKPASKPADRQRAKRHPTGVKAPRDDRVAALGVLIEASHERVLLLDVKGTIVAANKVSAGCFGRSVPELVGRCIYDLLPPDLAASRKAAFQKAIRTGRLVRHEDCRDGRWLAAHIFPIHNEQGHTAYLAVFASDVTASKEAEMEAAAHQRQLNCLLSELALAEERERRRIAGELHDRVGHGLVMAKVKLDLMRQSPIPDDWASRLEEVRDLVGQAALNTSSAVFDLSLPGLCLEGFEAEAQRWVERMRTLRPDIRFEFTSGGKSKPLAQELGPILCRALRELLVNAIKHAHAQNVRVTVQRSRHDVRVTVEDDGIGCDPAKVFEGASEKGGFGLCSIREHLDRVGGTMTVQSTPGRGTRFALTAPLKDRKQD